MVANISLTTAFCSAVTSALAQRPLVAAPIFALIFGIIRTTGVPSGNSSARYARPLPAAMETTKGFFAAISSFNAGRTAARICGFTASTRTSLAATTSAAVVTAVAPQVSASFRAEVPDLLVMKISLPS